MIKAIVLDIDGVIVGEKHGYNFPQPHTDILSKLKELRSKGVAIILCTAKPLWAIDEIIQKAELNNPHITNAGAVLIDPIDNKVLAQRNIEPQLAKEVLKMCLDNNIYVEFYTLNDYFIDVKQKGTITEKHMPILQREPKVVDDLLEESLNQDVVRIMPIAKDEEDKKRVNDLLGKYKDVLSITWGLHPVALPLQFGIITAPGISKKEGTEEIVKSLGISFDNVLGIGDTTGDWSFIQLCKFAGSVENGTQEIKDLVRTKGKGNYYIGKSVDENGSLNILEHFSKEF